MLGGMSWESTALYYRIANELVREHEGGLASADLVVRSVDFRTVRAMQLESRWADAGALLLREAHALEAAGADIVMLCTNYMHKVAPAIEAGLGVPFLHIADVVAEAATAMGCTRIGLTGAGATMAEPFYVERLARRGLDVRVPDAEDRALLDAAIFTELCQGVLSEHTRQQLRGVLARLVQQGVHAIVLGCTELELLLGPEDCAVPLLPSARLHITAAVEQSLLLPEVWSR